MEFHDSTPLAAYHHEKRYSYPSEPSISATRLFATLPGTHALTDSAALRSTANSASSDGVTQSLDTPRGGTLTSSHTPSRPLTGPSVRVGRHIFLQQHSTAAHISSVPKCPAPPPHHSRPASVFVGEKATKIPTSAVAMGRRRFGSRSSARVSADSCSTPYVVIERGNAMENPTRPSQQRPAASNYRERVCARVNNLRQTVLLRSSANGDTATPSAHDTLRFLGTAAVNDAPLTSFLACTTLENADIHIASADAARFRVLFPSQSAMPAAMEAALRSISPHSTGHTALTAVSLTVLDDDMRKMLRPPLPIAAPALPRKDVRTTPDTRREHVHDGAGTRAHPPKADAYGVPMWSAVDRDTLCLTPPSAPVSNMSVVDQELHAHYSTALDSDMLIGTTTSMALYPPHRITSPLPQIVPHDENAAKKTVATPAVATAPPDAAVDEVELHASDVAVTEAWRRYSSVAALYFALASVGGLHMDSLPFASVQLVPQRALLSESVRMEVKLAGAVMGASGAASLALRRAKLVPNAKETMTRHMTDEQWVAVAVERPMRRKGTFNRVATLGGVPSMQSAPFSDAEVFQLFYLQLIFRKFYDVRFPHLMESNKDIDGTGDDPSNAAWWTRTDYIGVGDRVEQGIAFEHPTDPDRYLFFPPFTRVLAVLGLEQAVLPMHATADQLQRTSRLPLAGSSSDVLCAGKTGHQAVCWAWTQDINSPLAATFALEGLFEQFDAAYGCSREELSRADVRPLWFRCSEDAVAEPLQKQFIDLSHFFVPAELRRVLSEKPTEAVAVANASFIPNMDLTVGQGLPLSGRSNNEAVENASVFSVVNASSCAATSLTDLKRPATPSTVFSTPVQIGQPVSGTVPPAPPVGLTVLRPVSPTPSAGADSLAATVRAEDVLPMSPFTKQESLVTRWRHYIQTGLTSIFDGFTDGIELQGFIGKGGSGLVFKGVYGRRRLPVAVKVFVIPDGMSHEDYVRESLTDVAFYVLLNQLDDFAICNAGRAHDFIVSAVPPKGLPEEDANTARRGADPSTTHLCYFVTDLMDGTLGRFVREDEDDYDPFYDTLRNSPLRDVELFQFLFLQLACKSLFNWRVLDLMLNGQLRGDNLGFRYAQLPEPHANEARSAYDGFLLAYQMSPDAEVRYLRFPMTRDESDPTSLEHGPLRFIFFIDLGQGSQPNVEELTRNKLIGETVVDSCVQDDGFGRYWPLEELYCRYVDVVGDHAHAVLEWGSRVRINSQDDAVTALAELLELYAPLYGCDAPSPEERSGYLQLNWSPTSVAELKKAYVYRAGI